MLPAKAKLLSTLTALARLPDDWDGGGSPSLDPNIVEAARKLLASLPDDLVCPDGVIPTPARGIFLPWHGVRNMDMEFETPDRICCLHWGPNGGVEVEDMLSASDAGKIAAHIRWFTENDQSETSHKTG